MVTQNADESVEVRVREPDESVEVRVRERSLPRGSSCFVVPEYVFIYYHCFCIFKDT